MNLQDRAMAAWLLWELCCIQAIAVHICAILLQHSWLQPALRGALAMAEPTMQTEGPAWLLARTSVGLIQVSVCTTCATYNCLDTRGSPCARAAGIAWAAASHHDVLRLRLTLCDYVERSVAVDCPVSVN